MIIGVPRYGHGETWRINGVAQKMVSESCAKKTCVKFNISFDIYDFEVVT